MEDRTEPIVKVAFWPKLRENVGSTSFYAHLSPDKINEGMNVI